MTRAARSVLLVAGLCVLLLALAYATNALGLANGRFGGGIDVRNMPIEAPGYRGEDDISCGSIECSESNKPSGSESNPPIPQP